MSRIDGIYPGYLDRVQVAALQLVQMHGDEACVTFDASQQWATRFLDFESSGCGSPGLGASEGYFPLRPTDDGDAMGLDRVEHRFMVPNAFFSEGSDPVDDVGNRWIIFALAHSSKESLACTHFVFRDGRDAGTRLIEAVVQDCFIVAEKSDEHVMLSPNGGRSAISLLLPEHRSLDLPAIGEPTHMQIADRSENWQETLAIATLGSC